MTWRRPLQLLVVLLIALAGLGIGSAAGAADNPDYTAPPPVSVAGNTTPQPLRKLTSSAAAPARTRMPITGADVTGLAVVGVALVGGGVAVLAIRRRTFA